MEGMGDSLIREVYLRWGEIARIRLSPFTLTRHVIAHLHGSQSSLQLGLEVKHCERLDERYWHPPYPTEHPDTAKNKLEKARNQQKI